jgi:hypothetical protein
VYCELPKYFYHKNERKNSGNKRINIYKGLFPGTGPFWDLPNGI